MKPIKCLVVDDEPIAREIIQTYCNHFPLLQVVACCGNALEAKAVIAQQPIELLFLDINMPVLNGISFLKTLKNKPQVIFTTAYKEFAWEAFDLAACDYLVKPFSLERFMVAIDKALEKIQATPANPNESGETNKEDYLFIKTDGKIYKIFHNDLLYAEASGNYTKFVTSHQTILPSMTFSSVGDLLPPVLFLRVHRSFIVNKSKITHIEGNRIFINQTELPIGSNYRESFLKALGLK
ncbi:MAG: LytTR family DNA-binding domain-containing protein [Bacteroidota bacterium]